MLTVESPFQVIDVESPLLSTYAVVKLRAFLMRMQKSCLTWMIYVARRRKNNIVYEQLIFVQRVKYMGLFENPTTWGRATWTLLNCVAMTYPDAPTAQQQKSYRRFLLSLKDVLPCSICRQSYKAWLGRNPPRLETKTALLRWLIDTHNYVNKRLGKPVLTYRQAMKQMRIQSTCV